MHKLIFLSLQILIYNIINLFLFSDPALSQKREFEVQDCYISVDKSELIISAGGGDNGCKYQHTFRDGSTEYQLNFDLDYNKPNSRVEIINNQKKYVVNISDFQGISTYIKTYFLHLNKKETPFLVVMYGTDGNGYSPCNFHKIMVFNQSIKSGNFLVKPEDLNVSPTFNFDDSLTISSCLSFEDLDSDNIYELIAPDNILAYAFSDFDLSGFGAFYKIKRITSTGIYDITNQHKNFMVKVAEKNWNEVLQKVSSAQKDNSQQSSEVIIPYFGNMVAYITAKSILGEYKEAMSLVTKRIEIDELNFSVEGQKFSYDVEEFLIERGYIKKSDGLMVYLPQNNRLTCQQSIDSVKAELMKRKYFIDYKVEHYGLIKPKLTIDKDWIRENYYDYSKNRTKTVIFQLSGEFNALIDFLRSRKLMESLTARILGSCQDFGLVIYGHWYEGYAPVGYFPDGSVRSFAWVDISDTGDNPYTRSKDGYTQYKWGYYFSP